MNEKREAVTATNQKLMWRLLCVSVLIFELLILYQKAKLEMNCQNQMKLFISFVEGIFCLAKRKYSSQTKLRPRQTKLALVKRNDDYRLAREIF